MRVGFIILCRYNSSRLPGKILKEIEGRPVLDYIYDRLKSQIQEDSIVVATSEERTDDPIAVYCAKNKINCFRGSLTNVAERFFFCAQAFDFDFVFRINGDNLFVDTDLIRQAIDIAISGKYAFISNVHNRTFPKGMSIEGVMTRLYGDKMPLFNKYQQEHVMPFFYDNETETPHYYIYNSIAPELAGLQLAIDTEDDYILAKRIISHFPVFDSTIGLKQVSKILKKMNNSFTGKFGPLLIAEIGGNHEGDFEYAKRLCQLAIESEADYVKFQIYTGNTLVSPVESPDRNKHFKKFELTREQHIELAEMVIAAGRGYTASIWDTDILEWIDPYMDFYKIGSGDLTAYAMIKAIAERKKPIIISTGLATEEEVLGTVHYIQGLDAMYKDPANLAVLQCTSMYPIEYKDANLNVMKRLKELTGLTIGYSDHTTDTKALLYATAMGAEILEFHFTDTKEGKVFRDHKVSLTKKDVLDLIEEIKIIFQLRGGDKKAPTDIEMENDHVKTFRRATYLSMDVQEGYIIKEEDLVFLRPNVGVDARSYKDIVGKQVTKPIKAFEKINTEFLK